MVFNATYNNISVISWRSVLLVEETGVHGENHRSAKLYHIMLCRTHNFSGDRHWFQTITTTMAPCSIEGTKNKYNKLMQYTGTNRICSTLVSFQYNHYERYIVMVKHSPELNEYQKDHDICRCKSRSWLGTGTQMLRG